MQFPPVIVRELREEARRPATGRLRAAAAGVVFVVLAVFWLNNPVSEGDGGKVFSLLNTVFCVAIWLIAPFTTADCISREKREGTLPLLFLTPLTPAGIVFGKVVTHALRAFSLLLAVIPVMLVCFMLGGLPWQTAVVALFMDSISIALALSAGLVASSFCREWNRAMGMTMVSAALFLAMYAGMLSLVAAFLSPASRWNWEIGGIWENLTMIGFGFNEGWGNTRSWNRMRPDAILAFNGMLLTFAVCVLSVSLILAHRAIRAARLSEPPSQRAEELERAVWRPRFWQGRFRRRMAGLLDRNPIGWLQRRTTGARVTGLCWLLGTIAVEAWMFGDRNAIQFYPYRQLGDWSVWLALLMLLSVSYAASGSFLRERQSGALELILVTPLSVGRIVRGRLLGIWGLFLVPSLILLGAFGYYLSFNIRRFYVDEASLIQGADTSFVFFLFPWLMVSLAVIGLHFSLVRKGFIAAFLSTVLFGAIIPLACLAIYDGIMLKLGLVFLQLHRMIGIVLETLGLLPLISRKAAFMPFLAAVQFPIALWAFGRLLGNLRQRRFIMTTN